LLVVGAVLVAVMVVVGVVRVVVHSRRSANLTVGQCVSSADFEAYRLRATACGDVDAVYEYAGKATMNICPDGKRTEDGNYVIVIDKDNNEKSCFAVNLKEGECYLLDISAKQINHAACAQAASGANSHTQRVQGQPAHRRQQRRVTLFGEYQSLGFHRAGTGVLPAEDRRLGRTRVHGSTTVTRS
jgi:hypothetical protein